MDVFRLMVWPFRHVYSVNLLGVLTDIYSLNTTYLGVSVGT